MKYSLPSVTLVHTGFHDLLCDAVYQHRLASKELNGYRENRHARASILASALSVECFANSLFESVGKRELAVSSPHDPKTIIGKINIYLNCMGAPNLDEQQVVILRIHDLRRLRNSFVHRKVENIEVDVGRLGVLDARGMLSYSLGMSPKVHWNSIEIPKNSMYWAADGSWKALRAAIDFFRCVVREHLGISPQEARKLLATKAIVDIRAEADGKATNAKITSPTPLLDEYREELNGHDLAGLDLGFLGLS